MPSILPKAAALAIKKAGEIYTQKQIATELGYSSRHISRWIKDPSLIPLSVIPALRAMVTREERQGDLPLKERNFTFIDLFAGIGGVRLGFESAGGECVFTSEWDSYAQKTYAENFGDDHPINGDITKVDAATIPDHDVLLAGFPCQPFSIAGVSKKNSLGRAHGFECTTQGTLFFDVARIIKEKRPAMFMLENVKNLLSHDKGNTIRVILDTLRDDLGYKVAYKVIDGKRFVPQHRERILIVGVRHDSEADVEFDWESVVLPEIKDGPKMGSILHFEGDVDLDGGRFVLPTGKVQPKYTLSDHMWKYLQEYAEKHRAAGNGFGCSVVKADQTSRTLSARYYKDGSEILIDRGSLNPRRLTPRECARIMGFPDSYRICVSDTRAYKQFGNSVVVPLIEHVAAAMKPVIMRKKAETQVAVQSVEQVYAKAA
jgi:DNA (cytosine-5)-methyltransferase 1